MFHLYLLLLCVMFYSSSILNVWFVHPWTCSEPIKSIMLFSYFHIFRKCSSWYALWLFFTHEDTRSACTAVTGTSGGGKRKRRRSKGPALLAATSATPTASLGHDHVQDTCYLCVQPGNNPPSYWPIWVRFHHHHHPRLPMIFLNNKM